ncbi:SpoVR family protein [Escherichia coli]
MLKRAAIRPNDNKPAHFMEKNAPLLESWQREILRIVRKVSQYFYPQKQTQVMNEGWATSGTIPSLTICMMKGK